MKKIIFIFSLLFFNLISLVLSLPNGLIFYLQTAHAASFSQSYIRLDRQKDNTPTTGLVCAEPVSAGVENNVSITLPANFSVSSTLSNWTVTTSDLPSDAVAWPGIGTATNVSGQTVTFPSSNLSTGTLYCFNWNKTQAVSTGSVGQQDDASIVTKTAGNVEIDSKTFPLYTASNDQLSVSATVEPLSRSAELQIAGSPNVQTILHQEQEVEVTISYRQTLTQSYPVEIIAEWSQGLIGDTGSNFIDIFEYLPNTATNAYGNTRPTVDPSNRRIIWNIPALDPTDEFQKVRFKMKVKGEIPTEQKIAASIKASGKIVNSVLPESSLTYTIKRVNLPVPSPTSVPDTTPFRFDFVRVDEISDTYFTTAFQTNRPSTFVLRYGTVPNNLNKNISGLSYESLHRVRIPDLTERTQYYFRITARDQSGRSINSDLYTVTTASEKDSLKIARDDFTVHWKKYFLLSQSIDTVVIPKDKPITITAKIGNSSNISKIKAVFTNQKVLGITTLNPKVNIGETPLIEILPGVFSGEIQSPTQKGVYSILFEITDVNGGLYKKQAPYKFYVSDPLRVIDKGSKKPIEGAEVKIIKYQDTLKYFAPLQNSFAVVSHTDENGELDIVLPTGKYDIEVKAPQYKLQRASLELGISTINYPVFSLERSGSLESMVSYYGDSLTDLSEFTTVTAQSFFSSQRAKDLYLIFTLILLLLLIILDTHLKKKDGILSKLITFSIIDVFVALSGISTLLFINYLGVSDTALIIATTIFIFILGAIYVRKGFLFRKKKTPH